MKTSIQLLILSVITTLAVQVEARVVTLTIGKGQTNATIEIPQGDVATVRYFFAQTCQTAVTLTIIKDGVTNVVPIGDNGNKGYGGNPMIAGPAELSCRADPSSCTGGVVSALLTLEILPESFPPDKTLIIPEGTGARVAVETSTNLLQWTEVWSDVYTNAPSNRFFRIKAERIP